MGKTEAEGNLSWLLTQSFVAGRAGVFIYTYPQILRLWGRCILKYIISQILEKERGTYTKYWITLPVKLRKAYST